jgi:hemerythrin-like domain-containing protein
MKRQKYLASLSSDHHHGLRIAKLLKSAKDASGAEQENIKNKLTGFFKNELKKHFEEEESFLVPPLKDNPLIMQMCEEHKKLNELFNLITASKADELKEKLISFGSLLEAHIRFEERELFPMIEQTLSEEILTKICRQIEKGKAN